MMRFHRMCFVRRRSFLTLGLWLMVLMAGLVVPGAGQAGEPLPESVAAEISQKLADLNLKDIAIDLNTRISVPDNTTAGI